MRVNYCERDCCLLAAILFNVAVGFLFDQGPECYQCDTAFSPQSCSDKTTCLLDQECSAERFLTKDGTQAYRLGCLSKTLCKLAIQPVTDTDCVRCCSGRNCNEELCMKDKCLLGYYGPVCTERCGHCGNGTQCDKDTGKCIGGCEGDYLEPFCDTKLPPSCRPNFYGKYCTEICGHCANGLSCEKDTGRCPNGCVDGYVVPFCHTACTKPWYGQECKLTCGHCERGECDPVNGTCKSGCEAGFMPPLCKEVRDWTLVFKAVQGGGRDIYADYTSGGAINLGVPGAKELISALPFRDPILDNWSSLYIKQVRIIFLSDNVQVAWFVFNGASSTDITWFSKANLLESNYPNLNSTTTNFFSIEGDPHFDRRFFINHDYYGSCLIACGFVGVMQGTLCDWERITGKAKPYFIYSDKDTCTTWQSSSDGAKVADRMAIFIK